MFARFTLSCALALLVATNAQAQQSEADDLVDFERQIDTMRQAGRGKEAIPLAGRLVTQAERICKDHPSNLAACLETAALVYWDQGQLAKADPLLKRVISIRQENLGKDHPHVGLACSNLGLVFYDLGRYAEAEQLFKRSLAIQEATFGRDGLEVSHALNNLALLYWDVSRYTESEQMHKRALAIRLRQLGSDHLDVAESYTNLGILCWTLDRNAEAEPLHQRALAIEERQLGKNHAKVAASLVNLANVDIKQGRYAKAIELFRRALQINEKAFGAEHPNVAHSMNNLAVGYHNSGQYQEAKGYYDRARAIWEKNFGPEHPDVAHAIDNQARLASAQGEFAEAERLFQQALAIREKTLGKEHPNVAATLQNMAESYFEQRSFAKAEPLIERALTICDLAGAGSSQRFDAYYIRALLRREAKKNEQAFADLNHALDLTEQIRGQGSGGETGRADVFATFDYAYERMIAWQRELGNTAEVLKTIERSRARSLIDQLATANVDLLAGVAAEEAAGLRKRESTAKTALAELEKQIEQIGADTNLTEADRQRKIKELDEKVQAARAETVSAYVAIRNASPVYRQMVGRDFKPSSPDEIQQKLVREDGLLLEYYLGNMAGYLMIIPPAGGKPRIESLEVTEEQAAALKVEPGPLTGERMRAILANEAGGGLLQKLRHAATAEETMDQLATLWQVLIPAAERQLLADGKLKRCLLIPDAALAAFPFDTLIVERGEKPKYWLDVGPPIVTAPSATLLMNLSETKEGDGAAKSLKEKNLLSVADPNYGVPSTDTDPTTVLLSARSRYGSVRGNLKPLPFTAWECSWVAELFRKAGLDVGVLQKASAREASVRTYAPGRKLLHFACHGLVDQDYGNLFGALALTPGPQGSANPADDGFLTLAEIYELNLRGNELSILSACDTNYGPNQKGEGTWSLSRGFLVAGSKRVVASNWLVDDEAGASLISIFCGELVKEKPDESLDYAAKLQAAKRWVRNQDKWKSPYYWGTFVLVGPN